jgi:hypothetical protein
VSQNVNVEDSPNRRRRILTLAAWVTIACIAFALLEATSLRFVAGNSDGATVILEGQAMAKGHLSLSGWSLSLDSFWSVDALFYMVGVLIAGVRASLMNVVPAIIAALVVCLGMKIARGDRAGESRIIGPAIVFLVLAMPTPTLAYFLVQGPLHVGTALFCLGGFICLSHNRFGWYWALAVVLFAAGMLGDLQMVMLGVAPAFFAGLIAMARKRSWRAGISAVSASIASVVLGVCVHIILGAIGGFSIGRISPFATSSEMLANLRVLVNRTTGMLGAASIRNGLIAENGIVQDVHVLAVLAVAVGIIIALVNLTRGLVRGSPQPEDASESWRLDDFLVIAFVADLVAFVILPTLTSGLYARYLTAGVIFGTILAGRTIGRVAGGVHSDVVSRAVAITSVAIAWCFIVSFAYGFSLNKVTQPAQALGAFLTSHQWHNGIGDYWSSSISTVETGGSVAVRPVIADNDGKLVRYDLQSEKSWYPDQPFQFVVYNTALVWGGVDADSATATFGAPERVYVVGSYRVLVWSHSIRISSKGIT